MATFTRKPQEVAAIKLSYAGTMTDDSTTPATTIAFVAGDWLVRRGNGKAEIMKDARFRELYAPKAGDTIADAMYQGYVDPSGT